MEKAFLHISPQVVSVDISEYDLLILCQRCTFLMKARTLFSLIILLVLNTSACSSSMKTPDIKLNAHPKMRYEITITIEDAPGPFDSIAGNAQYQVMNSNCIPMQPGSGATPTIGKSIPIVLTHDSDQVYRGSFYADLMQDEDYYGLGICHWELIAAAGDLQIKKVNISSYLSLQDVTSQKPVTRYFSNASYHNINMEGVDSGNNSRSDFGQKSNETFSVTLASKENFQ